MPHTLMPRRGSKEEQVDEWSCNQTERSRRVKGGDKRKKYMKEKQVEEEKKGLWDRIHAKRKRGEPPAKPGEKGYPKTLDVGEGLKQARKNVGSDSCWDGYKATGTKMKNGKEVPDCKKEGKFDVKANMRRKNDATQFVKQTGKALDQNHKDTMAALKDLQKRRKMREGIEEGMDHWIVKMPDQPGVKGKRNVPVKARTSREAIMKAAKRLGVDWKSVDAQAVKEGSSAQDRLSARGSKTRSGQTQQGSRRLSCKDDEEVWCQGYGRPQEEDGHEGINCCIWQVAVQHSSQAKACWHLCFGQRQVGQTLCSDEESEEGRCQRTHST